MSIKIFSRGKGRTAVPAAAYRSGEKIKSEYNGAVHDYTHRGGVVHTEILLPEHAPAEYSDRSVLWNAVEMSERNKNAQLAREVEISLPVELTREQNIVLAREYVKRHFVDKGMCADICVHDKNDGNPHAHIMLTLRPFNEDGTWAAKSKKEYILDGNGEKIKLKSGEYKTRKICTVDWNEQTKAEEWRAAWADTANEHLKKHGHDARIDHRSYERQGVEQIPTVHLGVAVSQMEKRGIRTERGDINRAINVTNQQIGQLRARITKVKTWLYVQPLTDAPSMVDVMSHIADGKNLNTRYQKIANLKTQANVLMFLQQNNVFTMERLVDKIEKMNNDFYGVSNNLKKVDRRLDTLATHLQQCDNLNQHRATYKKYVALDPKKRDAFYDNHSDAIQSYKDAKKYIETVMNGRPGLPVKEWKAEQAKLTADRFSLCEDYYRLRDETRSVEVLRRGAENIISENGRDTRRTRAHSVEL